MKLAMLLALAACQSGGGDDFGPGGGGGGPIGIGGNGSGDAGTADGGGGASMPVSGRVCILKDLRQPTLCDDTKDASRLVLTLGSGPAVALSKLGAFSFSAQLGTELTWHVRGAVVDQVIPSVMAFGTDNTIPVIETGLYTDFLNSVGVEIPDQQGSIVVRVLSGGIAASGVAATTTLPATNGTFYDGSTPLNWASTTTGSFGVVWFPGVALANRPPTTAQIGLSVLGGPPPVTTTATVENLSITFVTRDLK